MDGIEESESNLTWDDKLLSFWFSYGLSVDKEEKLKTSWAKTIVFDPVDSSRLRAAYRSSALEPSPRHLFQVKYQRILVMINSFSF